MDEEKLFNPISERIKEIYGIAYKPRNQQTLFKNLQQAAQTLGRNQNLESILAWLLNPSLTTEEYVALAESLTIGETYFFREITGLKYLTENIIPKLRKAGQNKLNIWSAGCSSGEEPYSLAIYLKEYLNDLDAWDVRIVATDLSEQAINKAKQAIYRSWSFRGFPIHIQSKYFTKSDEGFMLNPEIKNMVEFYNLNLVKDLYPFQNDRNQFMDVIYCRNVLMYFSDDVTHEITKRFYSTLPSQGWFLTSQTELSLNYFKDFEREKYGDGFFFQKGGVKTENINPRNKVVHKIKSTLSNNRAQREKTKKVHANHAKTKHQKNDPSVSTAQVADVSRVEKLFAQKKYQECIHFFETEMHQKNYPAKANLIYAKALANMQMYDKAIPVLKRLLEENKMNAEFYYFYATILSEKSDFARAEQMLVKALYLKPDYITARFSRFLVLQKLNELEKARKEGENLLMDLEALGDSDFVSDDKEITAGNIRQMINLMRR